MSCARVSRVSKMLVLDLCLELDGFIVWNVQNTVFGLKRAQLHLLLCIIV